MAKPFLHEKEAILCMCHFTFSWRSVVFFHHDRAIVYKSSFHNSTEFKQIRMENIFSCPRTNWFPSAPIAKNFRKVGRDLENDVQVSISSDECFRWMGGKRLESNAYKKWQTFVQNNDAPLVLRMSSFLKIESCFKYNILSKNLSFQPNTYA